MAEKDHHPDETVKSEGLKPSEYMRKARPEYYSDSEGVTSYDLSPAVLDHRLETVTARNETHQFEIFCRKLCERVICPNLKPATGPEGGGDSKADTETYAVSDEITRLTYVGDANAGAERWAFAFSAKKTWSQKARSDIIGIAKTGRGYSKVFFVTSRDARARDRAALEDELSKAHGFRVEILDRTWITTKVIEGGNLDLAYDYLNVGQQIDSRRLGPEDYSRDQRLQDLEKAIQNPEAYAGMESQRAIDALVAAKLSRGLERPRIETDGRFDRAIRLADGHGVFRQKLEARYERLWTAFYWFDEIGLVNSEYDDFAEMALTSDAAKNLEFACNLLQNIFNIVAHGHLTAAEVNLDARVERLSARLAELAADTERLNNALEAQTSFLIIEVNKAMRPLDAPRLSALWPEFSDVLRRAEGLIEYSATRVVQLIEIYGAIAGNDPAYRRLVDELAAFVGKRTSAGQGGLILLRRAQQLDLDEDGFEIIRLLGRATLQLAKKEYSSDLVEATYLLSVAYRSCGMLWAARANALLCITTLIAEGELDSDPDVSLVPALLLLGWVDTELRHLPETLDVVRVLNGCRKVLPLDDDSKARLSERLEHLDMVLATKLLHTTDDELSSLVKLPDVLYALDLVHSQGALMYALGHGEKLMMPEEYADEHQRRQMTEMFDLLATQPSGSVDGPLITNATNEEQVYQTRVLGVRVEVRAPGSEASILAAELLMGAVEVFFATTLAAKSGAHSERFDILIEEQDGLTEPKFDMEDNGLRAVVTWPRGLWPTAPELRGMIHQFLMSTASIIFAATCVVGDVLEAIDRLCEDDALLERMATVASTANSRQRSFSSPLSTVSTWSDMAEVGYPVSAARSRFASPAAETARTDSFDPADDGAFPNDHRKIEVRSVIDYHLWNKAGWKGVFFAILDPTAPPLLGLHFKDREAAREIFQRWRDRFGERDVEGEIHVAIIRDLPNQPASHYAALVTSSFGDPSPSDRIVTSPARIQTLQPETSQNLDRFLEHYNRLGCYFLAPAAFVGDAVEVQRDLMILKRQLPVKRLADIGAMDVEAIAVSMLQT